ncbi:MULTISPECIES: hypothetical protein [unclassified Thioalkalivibrio]|uniref:hypothetical protein n=1 Tax=unclassified Thioalkalivibrio TaxID=2621013 RepID=UPI0003695C0F|nr:MULTISPECIES: hypothetical protein [unclassified Thioalkalivibrio]
MEPSSPNRDHALKAGDWFQLETGEYADRAYEGLFRAQRAFDLTQVANSFMRDRAERAVLHDELDPRTLGGYEAHKAFCSFLESRGYAKRQEAPIFNLGNGWDDFALATITPSEAAQEVLRTRRDALTHEVDAEAVEAVTRRRNRLRL